MLIEILRILISTMIKTLASQPLVRDLITIITSIRDTSNLQLVSKKVQQIYGPMVSICFKPPDIHF